MGYVQGVSIVSINGTTIVPIPTGHLEVLECQFVRTAGYFEVSRRTGSGDDWVGAVRFGYTEDVEVSGQGNLSRERAVG